MDYLGIIKRAFHLTLRHKYLWIFGIFVGGIGGLKGFNFSLPSNDQWSENLNQLRDKNVLTSTSLGDYWSVILIILGAILLIWLVWFVLAVIANGAILGSVEAIQNTQENNFKIGFAFGRRKFWRTFATGLIFTLIVLLSLIVWLAPVVIFIVTKIWTLAIIWGILLFLPCLMLWLYLGLIFPYTLRLAVLGSYGAWDAFDHSWDFFKANWKDILIIYLLILAISFAVGIGFLILFLIVGGLLFGIGFGLYLASNLVGIFYGFLAALAFLILILIFGGVVNTFTSAIFTLAYLEMKKNF